MELTERQKEILMAIINEFMDEADEVGSLALVEKYDLGVSSATIRNEMVKLMKLGLLEKSNISSGRMPTDQALRLYVSRALRNNGSNPLSVAEIRQGIYRDRFSQDVVKRTILNLLSEQCESLVFMMLDGDLTYWGVNQLLKYDEFRDVEKLETIFTFLENSSLMNDLVERYSHDSGVTLLIGKESGINNMSECAIAFTKISFWNKDACFVGVIGSKRMDYARVIPSLKEVRNALEMSISGWR
ncbi:hypothetical protein J6Z48_00620 [bacterium]|nr:hypothetical protein [bacterium]